MYCIACGALNSDQEKFCHQCGKPLVAGPSPQAAATAPATPAAGEHAYRLENELIVPKGAPLPPFCVKCGQPVSGEFLKKKFYWHSPWLYLLILIGLLIYAIIAMILTKHAQLMVPLCDRHRERRKNFLIATWVLLLGFIPGGILVGSLIPGDDGAGWGFLTGFTLFLAGCVTAAVGSRLMRATEITETYATFKGVSEQFLAQLPSS
ncbi:MAG: double zinc ribbon domain-containing protein [Terriglobales bacterium]